MEAWTDAPWPCLIADRAPRVAGAAGHRAVIPARNGRANPQPHDPERYQARNAVERGIGWPKRGCRVATRYGKYV